VCVVCTLHTLYLHTLYLHPIQLSAKLHPTHRLPIPHTGTIYLYHIQAPSTYTTYRHRLPIPPISHTPNLHHIRHCYVAQKYTFMLGFLSLSVSPCLSLTYSLVRSLPLSLSRACALSRSYSEYFSPTLTCTHTRTRMHIHTQHTQTTLPLSNTHTHTHAHQGAGRGVGGVDGFDRFGTGSNLEIYSCHGRQ